MTKNVLVVGGGGREHALGYGLNLSDNVSKLYFTPGNGGTALLAKASNIELDPDKIVKFCLDHSIDLVVIGPEAPLVNGLADQLRASGILVFGPSKNAAQLESSKCFATKFMQSNAIPLPPAKVVLNSTQALEAISNFDGPSKIVIKADGLAGGKGVFLPDNLTESKAAIDRILKGEVDHQGSKLIIQQRYHGPELSIFVLSDGAHFKIILLASQDHKRLLLGDNGPMTGGVGAYAPLPDWMLGKSQWIKINEIAKKTINGMRAQDIPYQGVLYLGLMLADEANRDPVVIEYNARFGDPEAEVLIPLMVQNGIDLYQVLAATASGLMKDYDLPKEFKGAALTVCLSAANYPDHPEVNEVIFGLDKAYKDVMIFHGNTKKVKNSFVSNGGRVLFITGFGPNLKLAAEAANNAIGEDGVHFKGMQYRTDIGYKAFQIN